MRDIVRGNLAILATAPGVFGSVTALFGTVGTPVDAVLCDLNGDGAPDLVRVRAVSTLPSDLLADLYLNNGSGAFSGPSTSTGPPGSEIGGPIPTD